MSEYKGSCVGCKYLYGAQCGYSNYTVMNIEINCALDANKNLPSYEPADWRKDKNRDNWSATQESRCSCYSEGVLLYLDVEGKDGPYDYSEDGEQIRAICRHSDRQKAGSDGQGY